MSNPSLCTVSLAQWDDAQHTGGRSCLLFLLHWSALTAVSRCEQGPARGGHHGGPDLGLYGRGGQAQGLQARLRDEYSGLYSIHCIPTPEYTVHPALRTVYNYTVLLLDSVAGSHSDDKLYTICTVPAHCMQYTRSHDTYIWTLRRYII